MREEESDQESFRSQQLAKQQQHLCVPPGVRGWGFAKGSTACSCALAAKGWRTSLRVCFSFQSSSSAMAESATI
jgi:hypothetical protein